MNFFNRFTTWLLLLTVLTASGIVSAKIASGSQNFTGGLHQENIAANALLHLAKIDFSYDAASGSPVAANSGLKQFGRSLDDLAAAASKPINKEGLTEAARALTKHASGQRATGTFPKLSGGIAKQTVLCIHIKPAQ